MEYIYWYRINGTIQDSGVKTNFISNYGNEGNDLVVPSRIVSTTMEVQSTRQSDGIISTFSANPVVGGNWGIKIQGAGGVGSETYLNFGDAVTISTVTGSQGMFFKSSAGGSSWANIGPSATYPGSDSNALLGTPENRWKIGHISSIQLSEAAVGVVGTVTLGASTATTVGAAGGAESLPTTPLGYLESYVGTVKVKIPYYIA